MNVAEALNYFLSRVGAELEALGMVRNKKGDLWVVKKNSYKLNLQINVSPGLSGGSKFLFHTTLSIHWDDLSDYVLILENYLREERSMPPLKNKRPLLSVTDWLEVYQESGRVDKGVWFVPMEEVKSNKDFEKDFKELVEIALYYFSKSQKLKFCIDQLRDKGYTSTNLTYLSLASSVNSDFLHEKYDELRESNSSKVSWNESEMKSALHFTERNPFKPKHPFG